MITLNPIAMNTSVKRQRGLSLIELMISLTIGLLLLAGLTTLIVKQSSTRDELEKSSRQIENGRYAMQILHDDIEHAGFFGEYSSAAAGVIPSDPCNLAAGGTNSGWDATTTPTTAPVALYGYSGAATNPMPTNTCGLSNYQPNTAILVVRRVSTATTTAAAAVANSTYLQVSRCGTSTTPFVFGTAGFTLQ
jgi:type IV pilus assembly protein PilW